MLKPDENGILIGQKAKTLDTVQPAEFVYGAQSPFLERTYAFKHITMGMGQRMQEDGEPRRYYYGIDVDPSINGKSMKGPKFISQTVTAQANGAIKYIQRALFNNVDTIMVGAGQYLFARSTDGTGFEGGTATSGAGSTLTKSTATWTTNQWTGYRLNIFSGTGAGQSRAIASNTGTVITVSVAWSVNPDATSVFEISPYQLVKDFGSGTVNQMVRFKDADAGTPKDALYIALSTGNLAYMNGTGTTVAVMSGAEGPADAKARFIERLGDELWVAWDNKISKVEADPVVRTNWSAPITIGDASTFITWLKVNHNELFIFKSDGVFTIGTDGLDQELFPGLRISPSTSNGVNAATYLDSIWAPFGDSLYKITQDGSLLPTGSEQLLDNGSEVKGQHVGFAGHNTWFGYVVLYNSANSNSYLMKYGSWVEDDSDPIGSAIRARDVLKFRETWQGSLKKWTSKQAKCIYVINMPSDNDRLYVGFSNGTIEYCILPKNSPNPANDTAYQFTLSDSEEYVPIHHAGFQADQKIFRGFSVFGTQMSVNTPVEIWYRTDPNGSFVAHKVNSADSTAAQYTQSGQRIDFPNDVIVFGRQIEIKFILKNTTVAQTPIIEGIAIHEQVRPAFVLEYSFTVKAYNFLSRRDGSTDRRRAETIRAQMQDAVARVGTIEVQFPQEDTQEISYTEYQEVLLADSKRHGMEWDITIKGIQYRTLTSTDIDVEGSGNAYDVLEQFTYSTLEQYTYGQLESTPL